MQPMIFGFFSEEDMGVPVFAVSIKEDFQREGCLNDSYTDDTHRMFREWEQLNIVELQESIFEYPEGQEEVVINYLQYFYGFEHCPHLETFLREND